MIVNVLANYNNYFIQTYIQKTNTWSEDWIQALHRRDAGRTFVLMHASRENKCSVGTNAILSMDLILRPKIGFLNMGLREKSYKASQILWL